MKPNDLVEELKSHASDLVDTESYTKRLLTEAAALIEGLIPRPIGAIANETDLPALLISKWKIIFLAETWDDYHERWYGSDGWLYPNEVTHFIPLSAIQKLMESGE